jgi:hypothetical protein
MPRFADFMAGLDDGDGGPPPPAAGPTQRVLPGLGMIAQEETNWCWAAVTQSVLGYVHQLNQSQENIATDHAHRNGKPYTCAPPRRKQVLGGACGNGDCAGSCNDAHILRVVLHEQGCLKAPLSEDGPPSFGAIRAEIDAGRPVPCRIQWGGDGGGHFVIVSGWSVDGDGIERVHVLDPATNEGGRAIVERIMAHDDFVAAYELSGFVGQVNYSYQVG